MDAHCARWRFAHSLRWGAKLRGASKLWRRRAALRRFEPAALALKGVNQEPTIARARRVARPCRPVDVGSAFVQRCNQRKGSAAHFRPARRARRSLAIRNWKQHGRQRIRRSSSRFGRQWTRHGPVDIVRSDRQWPAEVLGLSDSARANGLEPGQANMQHAAAARRRQRCSTPSVLRKAARCSMISAPGTSATASAALGAARVVAQARRARSAHQLRPPPDIHRRPSPTTTVGVPDPKFAAASTARVLNGCTATSWPASALRFHRQRSPIGARCVERCDVQLGFEPAAGLIERAAKLRLRSSYSSLTLLGRRQVLAEEPGQWPLAAGECSVPPAWWVPREAAAAQRTVRPCWSPRMRRVARSACGRRWR